jgi:phosphate transport system permease protein
MKSLDSFKAKFLPIAGFLSVALCLSTLAILLFHVGAEGIQYLNWNFLSSFPSRLPEEAGILSPLVGSVYLLGMTAVISVPIGILTAIFLEDFATQGKLTRFIRLNIANLAAVPSIVYGMLGLAFFVRALQLERGLLATAFAMSLLILPVIIVAASEAIRAVPRSLREAAYGIGATRGQVVFLQVLPQALPGILTGIILALSRAAGETAPVLIIGGLVYARFLPESLTDQFTTLSVQIFNWTSRPQVEFHSIAAAGIIVLLILTLGLNFVAISLRTRMALKRRY